MADIESHSVLLRRQWASTWEAARFAAERPLHKPAFKFSACAAQLELAAQAVARIRAAIAANVDVMDILPLEGRSCSLLEGIVDGMKGMPNPVEDPVEFVQALVHAALQTGDGSYGLGLQGKEAVNDLIAKHCEDLLNAARGLQDPAVASRDLESASAELAAAVQAVLSLTVPREETVEFSSEVIQLSREMRSLVSRMHAVAAPKGSAPESSADAETTEPESSTEMSDTAALAGTPAFQDDDVPMAGAEADVANDADDAEYTPMQRTKSQVVKQIKVDEVAQAVEARREPIYQLRKALSQLDGRSKAPPSDDRSESRYDRTADDLKQVQKLQQSFRNFGEDLMEGMLALDQLSGLAEQDRQVRKDTLKGLQGLLDEIDTAKPRVAKMQKKLAGDLETLKPAPAEQTNQQQASGPTSQSGMQQQQQQEQQRQQQQQQQQHQQRQPLTAPRVDWTRLKLPVKFSSVERPRAYILSASVAGLDPDSIRLSRKEGGVLHVEGVRLPSAQDQRSLVRLLAEHIEKLPRQQRQRLAQEDADEMMLQLGHGRFGLFQQDFELPRDVDWQAIEPSYEDGVLRIMLPRRAPTSRQGYPGGGWTQGPPGYHQMPNDFLW